MHLTYAFLTDFINFFDLVLAEKGILNRNVGLSLIKLSSHRIAISIDSRLDKFVVCALSTAHRLPYRPFLFLIYNTSGNTEMTEIRSVIRTSQNFARSLRQQCFSGSLILSASYRCTRKLGQRGNCIYSMGRAITCVHRHIALPIPYIVI